MTINMLIFIFLAIVAIAAAAGLDHQPQHGLFGPVSYPQFSGRGGVLPRPGRSVYRAGADHRLCRRHHGALPVRDHAPGC